jgi:hypothetical protein
MAIVRTNSHFASRRVLGGVGAPGGEVGAWFGETGDGVDGGGNCGLASTRAGSTFSFIETPRKMLSHRMPTKKLQLTQLCLQDC